MEAFRHARPRDADEPAHTVTGMGNAVWVQRSNYSAGGMKGQTSAERGRTLRSLSAPSVALTGKPPSWTHERPATSVNGDPRIAQLGRHDPNVSGSQYGSATVRVTPEEAAILQSFPADYPWQGNSDKPNTKGARYQMIGNAVPPLLAEAILRSIIS